MSCTQGWKDLVQEQRKGLGAGKGGRGPMITSLKNSPLLYEIGQSNLPTWVCVWGVGGGTGGGGVETVEEQNSPESI